MDEISALEIPPALGSVTTDAATESIFSSPQDPSRATRFSKRRYTWRPGPALKSQVPDGFSITFDCMSGSDRTRRFAPGSGVEDFIFRASLAGGVILDLEGRATLQQHYSRHALRLFFQMAPRLREFLARGYNREQDLRVAVPGRLGTEDGHVLPEQLGLDSTGIGDRWGPKEVIETGRAAAVASGFVSPRVSDCIRIGILEGARRIPIDVAALSAAEARALVLNEAKPASPGGLIS